MKLLFVCLAFFGFALAIYADEDDLVIEERLYRDLEKSPSKLYVADKKDDPLSHIDFSFQESLVKIISGYSGYAGKALYSQSIDQEKEGKERAYYHFGGGYASQKAKLNDILDLNASMATALVGIAFERDLENENTATIGIDVAQPLYHTAKDFRPSVSINYGVKF